MVASSSLHASPLLRLSLASTTPASLVSHSRLSHFRHVLVRTTPPHHGTPTSIQHVACYRSWSPALHLRYVSPCFPCGLGAIPHARLHRIVVVRQCPSAPLPVSLHPAVVSPARTQEPELRAAYHHNSPSSRIHRPILTYYDDPPLCATCRPSPQHSQHISFHLATTTARCARPLSVAFFCNARSPAITTMSRHPLARGQ